MLRIELSKKAGKAVSTGMITEKRLVNLLRKLTERLQGAEVNIDYKELKGEWKGYHRVRVGDLRIIVFVDFRQRLIFVDSILPRSKAYRKR